MQLIVATAQHCRTHILPDHLEVRRQQESLLFLSFVAAALLQITPHHLEQIEFPLQIRLPDLVRQNPECHLP